MSGSVFPGQAREANNAALKTGNGPESWMTHRALVIVLCMWEPIYHSGLYGSCSIDITDLLGQEYV